MCRAAERRHHDERVTQTKLAGYKFRKRQWLRQDKKRLRMAIDSRKDIVWCRCDRCKNGTYRNLRQQQIDSEIRDYFRGHYGE